jgi:hypothetical protein
MAPEFLHDLKDEDLPSAIKVTVATVVALGILWCALYLWANGHSHP